MNWNAVRYDPASPRGHVESYFLKLNDPMGRRALWLKGTILAPLQPVGLGARGGGQPHGAPVAEAWAIAFDRAGVHTGVKQVIPYEEAQFSHRGLAVRVAELQLRDGHTEGSVASGGDTITWCLDFTTDSDPLVPFFHPKMYSGPLPSSKLVTPHPCSLFTGTYRVNDSQEIAVDGWRGMQGHNWGRNHAELYGWAHCNSWDDGDDAVLEGVTARVKIGPVLAPPLTVVSLWHRGVRYEFTGPRDLLRARGRISLRSWRFEARNEIARISGELSASTKDFAGLHYRNPNGEMTYCLNSKIAGGQVTLEVRGSSPLVLRTKAAALEIGTKDPSHGVTMVA